MVLQNMWESNYKVTAEQLKQATMVDCHRLKFAKPDSTDKLPPRPIIAPFVYSSDCEFLGNSKNMKMGSKIRVLTDLPPVMKREQGRLASVAYDVRKNRQVNDKDCHK